MGQPVDECGHIAACAARIAGRAFAIRPAWSGNVQMCPFAVAHKVLEKFGGRDGSAPSGTDIFQVRDCALELILEVVVNRHAPESLANVD